jgi:hypothetical protein
MWAIDSPVQYNQLMNELRIMFAFRCRNPQCEFFETQQPQPITRTALREMSQPDNTDKFMCRRCGQMFTLTEQEKAGTLEMLDREASKAS